MADAGPRFVIVGAAENIMTAPLSLVGSLMAHQDHTFASLVQHVLGWLGVRLQYGHPDLCDALYSKMHAGVSKASPEVNLSEDVFFAYDALLRGERTRFVPWISWEKGRETSIAHTRTFEDKLARGAAGSLRSPELFWLSRWLDSLTALSLLFGSVGFYLFSALFDAAVLLHTWVLVLMAAAGVDSQAVGVLRSVLAVPWLLHLGSLLGLPLLAQLVLEHGALRGALRWVKVFVQGSIFYLFHLRTKANAFASGLLGGAVSYAATGRGFDLRHRTLLQLYTAYARSHYHRGLQLLVLLTLYLTVLETESGALLRWYGIVAATASWLLTPVLFERPPPLEQLHAELAEVLAWTAEGWGAWWWQHRFADIRQRVLRPGSGGRAAGAGWGRRPSGRAPRIRAQCRR